MYWEFIEETTGIRPTIFRFPGGSVNHSNAEHRLEIILSTAERGYTYFDWNCSSGDGNYAPQDPDVILANVLRTARDPRRIIVIMHDSASKERGYAFEPLSDEVVPVHFPLR